MRELNTIELNQVNGAINIPAAVASQPGLTAAAVLGVLGLGVAAYFGYKKFCANSTVDVATEATQTAIATTVSTTSISG